MVYYQLMTPIIVDGQEQGWEEYSEPIAFLSDAQKLQRQLFLPTRIFRVEETRTPIDEAL